jgi:hypothetical protein
VEEAQCLDHQSSMASKKVLGTLLMTSQTHLHVLEHHHGCSAVFEPGPIELHDVAVVVQAFQQANLLQQWDTTGQEGSMPASKVKF